MQLQERRLQERQHLRLGRQPQWELRLRPLHRLRRLARHALNSKEPCSAWRLLQWARPLRKRTRLRLLPAASVRRLVVAVSVRLPVALHQVALVRRPEALRQAASVRRPVLLNKEALVLHLVRRRTIRTGLLPAHRKHLRTASLINRSTRSAARWSRTPARSIRTGSLRNHKAASAVLHPAVHKLAVLLPVVTVVRRRAATARPIRVRVVLLLEVATVVLLHRAAATVVLHKAAATAVRRRAVLRVVVTVVLLRRAAATVLPRAAVTARRNPAHRAAMAACPPVPLRWWRSAPAEGRSGRLAIRSWCS